MPKESIKKLLIVDGHSFAFRAYYAFQAANLKNSKTGQPSGAVFGFFRMLFKLLSDYKPSHVALTFDPGTPLDRAKLSEDYKANRSPMPEDLRPQMKEIYQLLEKINFRVLIKDGAEADDIIGTLCETYKSSAKEIFIVSGDKDLFQLLEKKNLCMLRGKKGVTDFVKIDKDWVKTELGVDVKQIPDYMGLVGDTSDNIPGVKGIGEKGALKLLTEYKTLEGIYKNLDNIQNKNMREKLESGKESAFLSRELATIVRDVDITISDSDLIIPDYFSDSAISTFKTSGYNTLADDLAKQAGKTVADVLGEDPKEESKRGVYKLISDPEELSKLARGLSKSRFLAVDTETTSQYAMQAELLGISFSNQEQTGFYVPIQHPQSFYNDKALPLEVVSEILNPIFSDSKIPKIGQNIKYDWIVLRNHGMELQGVDFDTMIASFLVQPDSRKHNMDALAQEYLNYTTITYSDLVGSGRSKKELIEIEPERVSEYASEDADITLRLFQILKKSVKDTGVEKVFREIDMPLLEVLVDIERTGVRINSDYFKTLSKDFERELKSLESRIHKQAGRVFNIASTKELQKVLFEDLGLPVVKKTQTGYSTDHEVLEELASHHSIVQFLLDYRKYTKFKSTYVDTLPLLIDSKTGRIHTSYNQTIAATGRLSSTDPNLQNIPIRDEVGREIRKGFIPADGFELLSLDYSQIELRIMAHFSGDEAMQEAYKKNLDIHRRTAAALHGIEPDAVTPEMRDQAKVVNFSVIYGVTPYGLSRNLKISREEAKSFIDRYMEQYTGVKAYMDKVVSDCEEKGYVETLHGRKRYLPDIHSKNRQAKEGAKRVAINSPIQGTSADMIKIAMIRIQEGILSKGWKSRMIMQVHDELVFEIAKKEKKEFESFAREIMENALPLDVPIKVEGKFGSNWDEAH